MGRESPMAEVHEANGHVTVAVKQPSNRYLDEILRTKCLPDLLRIEVFPNVKEITESMAAFNAVRNRMVKRFGDESIHLYVVGDGSRPRTAALFCHMTKWQCHSVDPALRERPIYGTVQRLTLHPTKIEEFEDQTPNVAVIVAVHSHADLKKAVHNIGRLSAHGGRLVVAIPCCTPQELWDPPDEEYSDWGVHSPKRTVKIWELK